MWCVKLDCVRDDICVLPDIGGSRSAVITIHTRGLVFIYTVSFLIVSPPGLDYIGMTLSDLQLNGDIDHEGNLHPKRCMYADPDATSTLRVAKTTFSDLGNADTLVMHESCGLL